MNKLLIKTETLMGKKRFAVPMMILTVPLALGASVLEKAVDIFRFKVLKNEPVPIHRIVRILAERYNIELKDVSLGCINMTLNNNIHAIHQFHQDTNNSTIFINKNKFKQRNAFNTLHLIWVILHELRHAMQHHENTINTDDYIHVEDGDMLAYKMQDVELDADSFAYSQLLNNLDLLFIKEDM